MLIFPQQAERHYYQYLQFRSTLIKGIQKLKILFFKEKPDVGSLNMAETTAISIGQIADIILISSTFPH
jgi:hypothetical protein